MANIFVLWAICTAVPLVVWVVAEIRGSKLGRRTAAGILVAANLVFALIAGVAVDVGTRLTYNMWHSEATSRLVGCVVRELERGRVEEVVAELRRLDEEFYPTYQDMGNWDELAAATSARLSERGEEP